MAVTYALAAIIGGAVPAVLVGSEYGLGWGLLAYPLCGSLTAFVTALWVARGPRVPSLSLRQSPSV